MAEALSITGAKEELCSVHDLSCGENDISLYRSFQRKDFIWSEMVRNDPTFRCADKSLPLRYNWPI